MVVLLFVVLLLWVSISCLSYVVLVEVGIVVGVVVVGNT